MRIIRRYAQQQHYTYSTIDGARSAISTYHATFRNPKLPPLELSDLYDLFPNRGQSDGAMKWPESWPGGGSAGVYLVIADDYSLVYIGKASMNSAIGVRLSSYFVFDENKNCRILHPNSWEREPRYIAIVAMAPDHRFEAPALEEYLIAKLQTTDNKAGAGSK